jgi:hypothetical protein
MFTVEIRERVPDPVSVAFTTCDSLELFGYFQSATLEHFACRTAMLFAGRITKSSDPKFASRLFDYRGHFLFNL